MPSTAQLLVHGNPDEAMMNGLRAFAKSSGVPMTVTPSVFGFTRAVAD